MMRQSREIRKLHKKMNDKGSAIVVVIIAMAFIGILASVLMYMSLLNYQMKVNNLKAKDNFYSAETVLDQIRLGMQEEVSDSLKEAYQKVLVNYETITSAEKKTKLRYYYLSALQNRYALAADNTAFDPARLFSYLTVDVADRTVMEIIYTDPASNEITYQIKKEAGAVQGGKKGETEADNWKTLIDAAGNLVTAPGYADVSGRPRGNLDLYTDGLGFSRLKIIYTDDAGYVSVIETDLRVKTPEIDFSQSATLPSLGDISLIAGDTLQVMPKTANFNSDNYISGTFYARRMVVGSDSDTTGRNVKLHLGAVPGATVEDTDSRMVVQESLVLGKGAELETTSKGELWTGAIEMQGSADGDECSMSLPGNDTYVSGDLMFTGKANKFSAGSQNAETGQYLGRYIGFGTGEKVDGDNTEDSAIIVNGTETRIDLSRLKSLTLAGDSYISVNAAEEQQKIESSPSPDWTNAEEDSRDILMGQSIAVKSDQLAYLVPARCIGIDDSGKSVLATASNPITLEQYNSRIKGKTDVAPVGLNIACSELGGNTLADYGLEAKDIQRYFRRVNSKITLVYFYVAFDRNTAEGRENASRYFRDYYNANKTTMDAYANIYTDKIRIRDQAEGAYILHLAGNVVSTKADGSRGMMESTITADRTNDGYQLDLTEYREKYQALCHKLLDEYAELDAAEQNADIFSNLVDRSNITTYYGVVQGDDSITDKSGAKYFDGGATEDGTTVKAVVTGGDYVYTGSGTDDFHGLIIATGNVTVEKSFQGTIIAGGNIYLRDNVQVQPDNEAVLQAMTLRKTAGSLEFHAMDFLKGGEGYLDGSGKTYNSEIDLGDLITYENWQKE